MESVDEVLLKRNLLKEETGAIYHYLTLDEKSMLGRNSGDIRVLGNTVSCVQLPRRFLRLAEGPRLTSLSLITVCIRKRSLPLETVSSGGGVCGSSMRHADTGGARKATTQLVTS